MEGGENSTEASDREWCAWFALCDRIATTTRPHPILGQVPICKRCDDKMNRIEESIRAKA